ncbi:C2 domain-containing protein [Colletotrichum graminicola]|uniref:C2 domain-containing protein n=1 Tax=Colletotrichum graminicola (strain M1.001 / M2 / FGSC 10212) TaxID=645133 RepID=E3QPQ7_COLGM|nr:C2 domain-containing protein [Colletotrichum graminicola M1.001]EFQ32834.1 C2 domain-containing protein [Colletotrichum graminicola M1.001]WDK16481.1 C2 domain-containing protein [Colletotrichum graminicola]
MAGLVDKLTASGGTESAGFLNDIIEQLWPNINVAGCRMVKDIVEPMFATMLPGPLASLKFVKLDLGPVPMRVSEVDVHKVDNGGIKLDMDVNWDGKSDIELDGNLVPKIGIGHVHMKGRLSILLAPLTNVIPLIGAAQVAFINPPELKLDFTDAANIADWVLVDKAVRKVIINIISSMAVLPNRYLVKLDNNNDYFRTYLPQLGALRLTIERAVGISGPKKSGAKRLLAKIVKDIPDCYCKVNVGAEEEWRTTIKKNDHDPEWNETHDFLVADYDQKIFIDVQDDDLGGDDDIGIATTTVKDILLNGGSQELELTHEGQPTDAKVVVRAKFFNFVDDAGAITSTQSQSEGQIVGIATVLIASALGLEGKRDELNPSIKVTWGAKEFLTAAKSYSPGTDIFNPSFDQAFRIPVTADLIANPANFKISLMNKTSETGSVEIPFEDVLQAPGLVREDSFDVGSGATVRASISLRGLQSAH